MEWTADVSAGDWIRERLDPEGPGRGTTMHGVVPRGFPAYARIFHRPTVAWMAGRPYPSEEEQREGDPSTWPEITVAHTTWAEVAAVFGTELHDASRWSEIAPAETHGRADRVIAPDGREYAAPDAGRLDAEQLATTARHLANATATPDDVRIAVWEGWGGIVGSFSDAPARAALSVPAERVDYVSLRHAEMLERSSRDPFNNVFRKPVWRPGVLPDDVSRGPRLSLPDRGHVLFAGSIRELSDPSWAGAVPWADPHPEWTPSPSLVWPADREWVLVTEVDADSTVVAGSAELVRALCTDPLLEVRGIREGAAFAAILGVHA